MNHIPVLLKEVIRHLDLKPNENVVDCTLGFAGHAKAILEETSPRGKLLGIDLDEKAIEFSRKKLAKFAGRCILVCENFKDLKKIVYENKFYPVHKILLDLGISFYQLQDKKRGFSYKEISAPLLMKFGGKVRRSAMEILNNWEKKYLKEIFQKYGEFRPGQAERLARNICLQRKKKRIKETGRLTQIALSSLGIIQGIRTEKILSRFFQAIRIAVNEELENLKNVLLDSLEILEPGGRIAVISYHSLEDRLVKEFFVREAKDCLCPPTIPICRCRQKARLRIVTRKPIRPSKEEIKQNPRSRSAKLRIAERIESYGGREVTRRNLKS